MQRIANIKENLDPEDLVKLKPLNQTQDEILAEDAHNKSIININEEDPKFV